MDGDLRGFDPMQVFEVKQKPCYKLTVKVLRGRNILHSSKDLIDKPDPYVRVSLSSTLSPNLKFPARTQTLDNNLHPEWNHTMSFLIDMQKTNILYIQLYDDDPIKDDLLGYATYDINTLKLGENTPITFNLELKVKKVTAEIDAELFIEEDFNPDLRYNLGLSDEEKLFQSKRRQHVFEAFKKLFGNDAPKKLEDTPGVGLIISGGGFRALCASSGVMKALHDTGVLDVIQYSSGLSGSTWYMSHLYAHPDWPKRSPGDLQPDLKAGVTKWFTGQVLRPDYMYKYLSLIQKKKKSGQSISYTDIMGYVVGHALEPNHMDAKLTDQAALVSTGQVFMPIYNAVFLKYRVPSENFYEMIECTPYEITIPKYGISFKPELFGSKFYLGRVIKKYAEPPLHFFQGIWGSAWAIAYQTMLKKIVDMTGCCTCLVSKKKKEVKDVLPKDEQKRQQFIVNEIRSEVMMREPEINCDSSEYTQLITGADGTMEDAEDTDIGNVTVDTEVPKWYQDIHAKAEAEAMEHHADPRPSSGNQVHPNVESTKVEYKPMTLLEKILDGLNQSPIVGMKWRAAQIPNILYGLDLKESYPISPFNKYGAKSASKRQDLEEEPYDINTENVIVVDAGIGVRYPFPPLLRPQRKMEVIIAFDFALRHKDNISTLQMLKDVEIWAKEREIPFPRIDEKVYDREGMKEVYIFEDLNDPLCPVVLHFPLVNLSFKQYKEPSIKRETKEEIAFGDFNVYEDNDYHTLDMSYTDREFDRLVSLTEYNVLNNIDLIKSTLIRRIQMKEKQRAAKMNALQEAVSNMAKQKTFHQGFVKCLGLQEADPSALQKEIVQRFMAKVKEDPDCL